MGVVGTAVRSIHPVWSGLAGWLLAALGLMAWFYATPGELGLFAVAVPFVSLAYGFPVGLLCLAVHGVLARRRRGPWTAPVFAAIFLVPPLLAFGAAWLLHRLVPGTMMRSDGGIFLTHFALAWPAVFLVVAASALLARRQPSPGRALRAGLVPSLVFLALLAVEASAILWDAPEFRYGGDFDAALVEADPAGPGLRVALDVTLPANPGFAYSALYLQFASGSSGGRADHILWNGRPDPPSAPGTYRVTLIWDRLDLRDRVRRREVRFEVATQRDARGLSRHVQTFRLPIRFPADGAP